MTLLMDQNQKERVSKEHFPKERKKNVLISKNVLWIVIDYVCKYVCLFIFNFYFFIFHFLFSRQFSFQCQTISSLNVCCLILFSAWANANKAKTWLAYIVSPHCKRHFINAYKMQMIFCGQHLRKKFINK